VELDKQIMKLDEVYVQNKDFEVRMKRAKEGLLVILRQAFTNKLTRFCAMLLVVAIIGVVVVIILRSNGTIA
jgi:flagellar biosynthesis/type III secretory pathway M-ring protein FliF/YscJ